MSCVTPAMAVQPTSHSTQPPGPSQPLRRQLPQLSIIDNRYLYGQTPCYARHVSSVLRCRVGFVRQVCDFGHLRCYAVLRTCCRRVSRLADDLCAGVCFCRKYVRCLLSHISWANRFLQCYRGKVSFWKVIHPMIKVNSSEGCDEAWL